jgi:hypothetical protein
MEKRLNQDKKFIVHASTQAQKATDYILNVPCMEREEVLRELRGRDRKKSVELSR